MQINHLIVDEILINETNGEALHRAALYSFDTKRWVSTHVEGPEKRLGPIEIVDQVDLEKAGINVTKFGQKRLYTDGPRNHKTIHYKDDWSIPTISVYSLVLPLNYFAEVIDINTRGDEYWKPQLGITPEGNLFYHMVFADWANEHRLHYFDISARLVHNPKKVESLALDMQTVEGTDRYKSLAQAVAPVISNIENWLKLLEVSIFLSKIGS